MFTKHYMLQNAIWSLLQNDAHNMKKISSLCMFNEKINVLLTIYWDNNMFNNPNFPITNI
jgi:hypothetical protein